LDRLQGILGQTDREREEHGIAYRVMVDHGRAMTVLMGDGVSPGNEGRSYVLRMIMRRAMRFGRSAGIRRPFLADLAGAVVDEMGDAYPELVGQRAFIQSAAGQEEERFAQTLTAGIQRLEELIDSVQKASRAVLSGDDVFRLYDTFGFPIEMTRDVARERGLAVDEEEFRRAMGAQREQSRSAQSFRPRPDDRQYAHLLQDGLSAEFVGYKKYAARARILALLANGERVDQAAEGTQVEVVLDRTPFYAEGGGQVADTGRLQVPRGVVEVTDTQRPVGGLIVHRGRVSGVGIRVGQPVRAEIDIPRRQDIMRNHTATHLLHQALRDVLGEHARQAGSLVAPDRLRFDFSHATVLSAEQRAAVERQVNEHILADLPVRVRWMSYKEAVALGAMALFGEKYGERVRVVAIGEYSRELCGGTHLSHTSQAGLFKITTESSVAAGIRRLEAVTGRGTYDLLERLDTTLRAASERLRTAPDDVPDRVRQLIERAEDLERELRATRSRTLASAEPVPMVEVEGITFAFAEVAATDQGALRAEGDRLRTLLDRERKVGAVIVGSPDTGALVVTRTTGTGSPPDAGRLVRVLAEEFGGSGGGRPAFGQGGLKDPSRIADLVRRGRDPAFLMSLLQRLSAVP
jgi:alanyl-tRNA synthetase